MGLRIFSHYVVPVILGSGIKFPLLREFISFSSDDGLLTHSSSNREVFTTRGGLLFKLRISLSRLKATQYFIDGLTA
jgi:hypothetical protein